MTSLAPRVSPAVLRSAFGLRQRDFAATVMRQGSVDPVIAEVVRLRCASYHDCRFCGSVRSVDARDAGLDESSVSRIVGDETADLPEDWQAALRLTDAMIVSPGAIPADVRDDVRRHFSDEQISEMLFDIFSASYQKTLVALRVEPPAGVDPVGIRWGADGRAEIIRD